MLLLCYRDFEGLELAIGKGLTCLRQQLCKSHLHLPVAELQWDLLEGMLDCVGHCNIKQLRTQQLEDTIYSTLRILLAHYSCDPAMLKEAKLKACRKMLENMGTVYSQVTVCFYESQAMILIQKTLIPLPTRS